MSGNKKVVLGIKDRFHSFQNGEETPEIRSDQPCFTSVFDFLGWCAQHGADFSELYTITDGKIWLYEDFKIINVCGPNICGTVDT
jgi:hypothetical protein